MVIALASGIPGGHATVIRETPHVHRAVRQQKKEHMRPRRDDWEDVQARGSKYAEKSKNTWDARQVSVASPKRVSLYRQKRTAGAV